MRARKEYPLYDWYYNAIMAMYAPLAAKAKSWHPRLFLFRGESGDSAGRGFRRGDDIIVTLKNTRTNYYPTFPPNPNIGHTGSAPPCGVRYWGQFFGMGFFRSASWRT
jgi:hypothetical protein